MIPQQKKTVGEVFLYLFLGYSLVASFINGSINNSILRIIDDVLFLVICVDILSSKKIFKINIPSLFAFGTIIFLLFLMWGYLSETKISVLLMAIRQYKYIFIIPFIFLYKIDIQSLLKFVRVLLWVSMPVSIMQRMLSNNHTGDDVIGVFSGSGSLSTVIILMFFIEHFKRVTAQKSILGLHWFWLIPMGINETKYSMIIFIILFVIPYLLFRRLKLSTVAFLPIFVIMAGIGSSYLMEKMYGESFELIFSKEYLDNYFNAEWETDIGRATKIKYGYEIIAQEPANHLFGYGLGASYVARKSMKYGVVADSKRNTILFEGTQPQIFTTLVDFGVLGSLLIVFMITLMCFKGGRYAKKDSGFLFGSMFLLLSSIPYNNILINKEFMTLCFIALGGYFYGASKIEAEVTLRIKSFKVKDGNNQISKSFIK